MLSKENRVRKQKEFDKIYSQSKKIPSINFQIRVRFIPDVDGKKVNKFGIVVSKKIGGAVVRNRVKRLIREVLRKKIPDFPKSFEAIIITYPSIVGKTLNELDKELTGVFKVLDLN